MSRLGAWPRRLAIALAVLLALWALAWLAVPPLLKSQAQSRLSELLGRSVSIGAVDFRPWSLELTVSEVAIGPAPGGTQALLKLARQHGLTLDELEQRRQTDSWCTRCKAWHPHSEFGKDGSRFNGLAASCRASRNACARAVYQPSARHRTNGRRYVQARDGDKLQARRRVNHLVDVLSLIHISEPTRPY